MFQSRILLLLAVILGLASIPASAQMARNPKLAPADLEAAQVQSREAGGPNAELIYAARLDAVQKGAYDSLIVVYAKPVKNGKDYFAFVSRDSKRFPLALDKEGRALKSGDKYLRIGLKHEEGKSPLLRLMGATPDPTKGEMQRNVDFQFNGTDFAFIAQSMTPLPK